MASEALREIRVNARAVGQTKDHFACTLTNGRASVAGIMFHCAAIDALLVNDAVRPSNSWWGW